ncbi:MAG: hypothetical protein JOZ49_15095 [Mycolicibacterium sp.]|nr:hypothetical protein [Mycolicibacterium sp.]
MPPVQSDKRAYASLTPATVRNIRTIVLRYPTRAYLTPPSLSNDATTTAGSDYLVSISVPGTASVAALDGVPGAEDRLVRRPS